MLQNQKRDNKRKALAFEDTPHKMLAIEDTPEANRPVDVPAPDGTHANDSNDHIDNDIPAQVHAPEADAVAKQPPVQDKDQGNHNDSEDSSSNSSSSESDSVPNVNTSAWPRDFHDAYQCGLFMLDAGFAEKSTRRASIKVLRAVVEAKKAFGGV